jgi:hypothetical protein
MRENLTAEVWVWLTQLLHPQALELHWQLEELQELTMKRGNQHDGNATYAKDRRTSSFEHKSRPFQRRLFLDEVVRRVLERVLGGPRVKTIGLLYPRSR